MSAKNYVRISEFIIKIYEAQEVMKKLEQQWIQQTAFYY